jgi:hypothetical protein
MNEHAKVNVRVGHVLIVAWTIVTQVQFHKASHVEVKPSMKKKHSWSKWVIEIGTECHFHSENFSFLQHCMPGIPEFLVLHIESFLGVIDDSEINIPYMPNVVRFESKYAWRHHRFMGPKMTDLDHDSTCDE